MGERPRLRALEAHGDMIRSVLLGRERGDSGGAFMVFLWLLWVSPLVLGTSKLRRMNARGEGECV